MKRAVAIATVCGSLALAVTACASSSEDSSGTAAGRSTAAATASAPAAGAAVDGVRLLRVGTFESPTYLAAPPGDPTRRFVTERAGRIVLLRGGRRSTFLDIRSRVRTDGENGLLSMAFSPDYASSRRYYVYYADRTGAVVIAQFRSAPNGNRTLLGSGRRILRQPHPSPVHKGGQLQFGHDGKLYAAIGDGGGISGRNAQELSHLLGKIVRIEPKAGGGYSVPRDNPFVGRPGARGEVFSYGLRNPYRFSFDRRGGDLVIADVGQDAFEEVDLLPAGSGGLPRGGVNLGWPVFEGTSRYGSGSAPGHQPPVLQRSHSQGACSITGGYVIRDRALGPLQGAYVYGDLCDSRLRVARLRGDGARGDRALGPRVAQLVSFGEDARGRVYAVSLAGGVFRLAARR